MSHTIGYHLVFSAYGLWLPGDERGHWSTAWDEQIGLVEPHTLHSGDPVRKRMAAERMDQPPVVFNPRMVDVSLDAISRCAAESDWSIVAASAEATHTHLLLTFTIRDINNTVKWLKDQTTKAVHRGTPHAGPIWCKGRWRGFIFDPVIWRNTVNYIEQHNVRRGEDPRPYSFLVKSEI